MEEYCKKNVVNHFATGSNCQVFNGNITGCVFSMPDSTKDDNDEEKDRSSMPLDSSKNDNDEELFHFIHPAVDEEQERDIHNEVKRLVKRQGIQVICQHLLQMKKESRLLLPPNPSIVYAELVRIGMPITGGFNENTFRKYYRN